MAETMQIDGETERLSGQLANRGVNRPVIHWTALIGSPQAVVRIRVGNTAAEMR